jgi:hypothetical protein
MKTFEPPLDKGIEREVLVLPEAGIEIFESGEGSNGHAYSVPTVRFYGDRSEEFRALAVALQNTVAVSAIRRTWPINDGEPTGPWWEITFSTRGNSHGK